MNEVSLKPVIEELEIFFHSSTPASLMVGWKSP